MEQLSLFAARRPGGRGREGGRRFNARRLKKNKIKYKCCVNETAV